MREILRGSHGEATLTRPFNTAALRDAVLEVFNHL